MRVQSHMDAIKVHCSLCKAVFLEMNTIDESLALSQNGVKLQSRFFSEVKCFLDDENQTRTLAA